VKRAAVLVLAMLAAGCAAPAATVPVAPVADPADAPRFLPPLVLPLACTSPQATGAGRCFEPTVAADPAGRIFVTQVFSGEIAVSEELRDGPDVPLPPPANQNDAMVHVDPSGRLYYSAIIVHHGLPPVAARSVQVAWSDDGARTWESRHLWAGADPTVPVLDADRQWLGFGADGEVYLTFGSHVGSAWFGRSLDRGETWGGWLPMAPSGPSAIDAAGRVFVPSCDFARGRALVHVSTDRGMTFEERVVSDEGGCGYQPRLVVLPEDVLVVAWYTFLGPDHLGPGGLTIRTAFSNDAGATWSASQEWAAWARVAAWPVARGDGLLDLVWLGGEDVSEARAATGPHDGTPIRDDVAASIERPEGDPVGTDFAHAARAADGRLLIPIAQPDAVWLLMEAPT